MNDVSRLFSIHPHGLVAVRTKTNTGRFAKLRAACAPALVGQS